MRGRVNYLSVMFAFPRQFLLTAISLLFLPISLTDAYHCVFDAWQNSSGTMPAIIRELPLPFSSHKSLAAPPTGWGPLRIGVFWEDLDDSTRYCTKSGQVRPNFRGGVQTCLQENVLTPAKRQILTDTLIPRAVRLHGDKLYVSTVTGAIVVPRYTSGICAEFTIPTSHGTDGVRGADMLFYAAAGPLSAGQVALTVICSFGPGNRPVVGAANFNPRYIDGTTQMVRVVAHEMAHALGFSSSVFERLGMVRTIASLRGKSNVLVMHSPLVLNQTRSHFGCATAPGMEMEDEGGEGTALSHWKRRSAKDELMSGIVEAGYYSVLTMAAMEATGFYRAQWGKEEPLYWGKGVGCDFMNGKCVIDGRTQFDRMFCDGSITQLQCTSDRVGLGQCNVQLYGSALPSQFQYFADARRGGPADELTDYCPLIKQRASCVSGRPPYSVTGTQSRCASTVNLFSGSFPVGDICVEVWCDGGESGFGVRYAGDATWHACRGGDVLTPSSQSRFSRGSIICPYFDEVCSVEQLPGNFTNTARVSSSRFIAMLLNVGFLIAILFIYL